MQHLNAIREQRISVIQGSSRISADATVVMTTVLGSCVACCLYDPQARLGGMNHFLLSEGHDADERYGLFAMEYLVNAMLKGGARRGDLRAHLYGGANLNAGMAAIGQKNAEFARRFLEHDGIPLVHSDLGGHSARRVDFRAARGQARCLTVTAPVQTRAMIAPRRAGEVEFF